MAGWDEGGGQVTALIIGLAVFISYTIVTINVIAASKLRYGATAVSSLLFCSVNFLLIRKIAEASTLAEFGAYAIGGMCGDLCGIWISHRLHPVGK